jgi:hypothetical protein
MRIWITRFEQVADYISTIAKDLNEAHEIAENWLSSRDLPRQRIFHDSTMTAWECPVDEMEKLASQGRSGVACYTVEHGWICIPPNIAAPGPFYLVGHPTEAFRFATNKPTGRTIILASHFKHAWELYHQWAKHHGQEHLRVFRSEGLDSFNTTTRREELVAAMKLGVTGVVSKIGGEYDVLPTWDENAGVGI